MPRKGAKKRAAAVINFADDDVQPLRITPGRQSAKRRRAVSAQDDIEAIENVGPIEAPQSSSTPVASSRQQASTALTRASRTPATPNSNVYERTMPNILNASTEFGSPRKFWASMCEKSSAYDRDSKYLDKLEHVTAEARTIVIGWLMDVCQDIKLHRETLHLTIDFFDRYLSKLANEQYGSKLASDQLQLVAVACLLIAAKVEEIWPPRLADLVDFCDGACDVHQVLQMEAVILTALKWHCSPVTSVHWLAFYLQLISEQELEHAQMPSLSSLYINSQECSRVPPISLVLSEVHEVNTSMQSIAAPDTPTSLRWTAADTSLNQSSFLGMDESQMRHMRQISVPKLMRDDFMTLTKMLDFCMLDATCLKHSYSEIAAALVMNFYEPRESVARITGFRYERLHGAIRYVKPVMHVIRNEDSPGVVIPHFANVNVKDQHNIQIGYSQAEQILDAIKAKRAADAVVISRTHPKST